MVWVSAAHRRRIGLGASVALLAALALAGTAGSLSPQQLADRFVAALEAGEPGDVADLLSDEATIVTWLPALPRGRNSMTMTLLAVGRSDEVVVGEAFEVDDYQAFTQGLGTETRLVGCETHPPDRDSQRAVYDVWVACGFASTNSLSDTVTGRGAVLRGDVEFGIAGQEVAAVLLHARPSPDFDEVWDFMHWVWRDHPAEFERWLRGRFQNPEISGPSAAALSELAVEYAALARGGGA